MARCPHFVLTRLNLRVDYAAHGKHLDEAWLEARLEPFERFCLPSMQAQDDGFRWLMFVDPETPASTLARLGRHAPLLEVVPLAHPHSVEALARAVADRVDDDATHVLTTRLDSDDALAAVHLKKVRAAVQLERAPHFINLPYGLRLAGRELRVCVEPSNPFVSLVEPADDIRTAYRVAHQWAARVAPLMQVLSKRPAWLQVIHAHNEVSETDGVVAPLRGLPRDFSTLDVSVEAAPLSAAATDLARYAWRHRLALTRTARGTLKPQTDRSTDY